MKRYIQIMFFVLLFTGTGCADWINIEPENAVTFENYFQTEKDAQSLLYTLESNIRDINLPFAFLTELHTEKDFTEDFLPKMFANFESYYATIASADMIIDNAFRFPLAEEVIRPYVLQAYFAKAAVYFQLATDFGEAPIIKDGQSFSKYGKSSVSEVLDEAEKWALLALELPKYEDLKLGGITLCKQYASKGIATALLAKIYAWRAGVEGKEEYWEKSEELCTQIIDNEVGIYGLASDPNEVCSDVMKRDHRESIWEFYRDTREQSGVFYHRVITDGLVGFPVLSTESPLSDPSFFVKKETVREFFDKEDLRRESYFWATDADSVYVITVNGKTVASAELIEGGTVTGRFGNQTIKKAFCTKFRHPNYVFYDWSPEPFWSGMNQNVVKCRLADIILLRAECRVRQGKSNAVDDLNEIRKRAYGTKKPYAYPNVDDVAKGLDKDLQLAIFREREKELFQEGHRYYDARRNGVEYVQRCFPPYATLSDQDIKDGALYVGIVESAFDYNDLLRQNVYWNRRLQ